MSTGPNHDANPQGPLSLDATAITHAGSEAAQLGSAFGHSEASSLFLPDGWQPRPLHPAEYAAAHPVAAYDPDDLHHALCCVLRLEGLQHVLGIGMDSPSPLVRTRTWEIFDVSSVEGLVWQVAALAYRDRGSVPDRATLQAATLARLRDLGSNDGDRQATVDFFDECYGARYDHLDWDCSREHVVALLDRVIFLDQIRSLSIGMEGNLPDPTLLELLHELHEQILAIRTPGQAEWLGRTLDEIARLPPPTFLINDVLVAGELALWGGPQKSLKTKTAFDASVALSTGGCWCGREEWQCPTPVRVGFLSGETGLRFLHQQIPLVLAQQCAGLTEATRADREGLLRQNLRLDDRLPNLGDPASIGRLLRAVERQQIAVLFLDPINACLGKLAKDAANTPVLAEAVLSLAKRLRDLGCTVVLLGHPAGERVRKQQGRHFDPMELADLSWPGLTNSARQWALVNRSEAYDPTSRISHLWLSIGSSCGARGGEWHLTVVEGANFDQWRVAVEGRGNRIENQQAQRQTRQTLAERERERRILDYIRRHPGSSERAMIRDTRELRGIGPAYVREALENLQGRPETLRSEDDGSGETRWYAAHPHAVRGSAIENATPPL